MTLESGTRVGKYEIQSLLGAGGMGEVYRALDTELHRPAALKFLPLDVASDERRMSRFEQEARAASALNHPNILTVYEIGRAEGGVRFFAAELVEGTTLRQRMSARKLSLGDVLDVCIQVASALVAAHAKGIVHRDIKPENVMIRHDGYVKVLDFGLAKPTASSSSSVDTQAATRALVNTDPGAVMGTVAYMSPEQATAKEVDARTDIWSLGVVLYEMVTGHVPFEGATTSHCVVSILEKEPPPLSAYVQGLPEALEWVVTEALTKDREERTQTARELLKKLQRLKQRVDAEAEVERSIAPHTTAGTGSGITSSAAGANVSGAGPAPPTAADTGAPATLPSRPDTATAPHLSSAEYVVRQVRSHKWGAAVLVTLLVAALGGAAYGLYRLANREVPAAAAAKQMKISRLVTGVANIGGVSVSPDGKYVAYGMWKDGDVSLRVRQVSTGSDREIVPPMEFGGLRGTAFSPDGELVYYTFWHRDRNPLGTLYQVPVIGGREPKRILDHINGIISFAPDGRRFAFFRVFENTGDSALMVGSTDGGEPRQLARRSGNDWFNGVPAWSPDGKVIVCPAGTDTGGTQLTLVEVPADGGAEKPVGSHKWYGSIGRPTWLKDGSGLIVNAAELPTSTRQIWHVSYPAGAVSRVTNDLTQYGSQSFGMTADSSTIVTLDEQQSSKVWLARPNEAEAGARKLTDGKYDGQSGIDWTPDGRIVYVARTGDHADIWMTNADGTGQKQLTANEDFEFGVRVSHDGRHLAFSSARAGGLPHVWRMDADGGNPVQLTGGDFGDGEPFWSPDGRWVFFGSWRSGNFRLWKVPAEGGEPAQVTDLAFSGSRFIGGGGMIVGDYYDEQVRPPRWRAALFSPDAGHLVKVFDLPPRANWGYLLDERTLIYVEGANDVDNLWTRPLEGGAPKQLTRFTSEQIFRYAPSRDGKQFAVARGTNSSDIILIRDFR